MVKPMAKMLVKAFLLMPESMVKPLIVDDAEVNVEALRRKVGEGVVDDRGDVVRSSPTPLG
jgi:hypothetical protein